MQAWWKSALFRWKWWLSINWQHVQEKMKTKKDGLDLGTISLNHSLVCRLVILFGCVISTFVLITIVFDLRLHSQLQHDFKSLKYVFRSRKQHLKRVCQTYLNPRRPESVIYSPDLLVNLEHFVTWKNHQHVAMCHTLEYNHFHLNKVQSLKELEDSYKILLVRHPFERILASYHYFKGQFCKNRIWKELVLP